MTRYDDADLAVLGAAALAEHETTKQHPTKESTMQQSTARVLTNDLAALIRSGDPEVKISAAVAFRAVQAVAHAEPGVRIDPAWLAEVASCTVPQMQEGLRALEAAGWATSDAVKNDSGRPVLAWTVTVGGPDAEIIDEPEPQAEIDTQDDAAAPKA